MDNENGQEYNYPQANQPTAPQPPLWQPSQQQTSYAPPHPSDPVSFLAITSSPVTESQAPPLPSPRAPPPLPAATSSPPGSPQVLVPPWATPPPRPARSLYTSGPPQPLSPSRFTEFEGDRQFSPELRRENGNGRDQHDDPLPPLPTSLRSAAGVRAPLRTKTLDSRLVTERPRSEADWAATVREKSQIRSSFGERLDSTVKKAVAERDKYASRAKLTGITLNAALGLQVLFGSLTTGLSAATTTGRQTAVATTVLGALSTLIAGYTARARGYNEPELSLSRVKDLDQFIRKCEAFTLDFGHITSNEYDEYLYRLRREFEELLGNSTTTREPKLASPV